MGDLFMVEKKLISSSLSKSEAIKQLESLKRLIMASEKSKRRNGFLTEDIIALNMAINSLKASIRNKGDF
jgi:hypothetical protein